MRTWTVRIHFTEPTWALSRSEEPKRYQWTWTGEARSEPMAIVLATQAFRALFAVSGVGWVREISSVHAEQVSPALPVSEDAHA
ncbi:MAG: hypothetical protein JNJ54_13610 [Myxococcaceae bacterium]|nr:hypothetical protein [Myxococcaceae bacterium]